MSRRTTSHWVPALALLLGACLAETAGSEPQQGPYDTAMGEAEQALIENAVRARGLDPSDMRVDGDRVIVEGDISFSRDELLADASTLVEKGYVVGTDVRDGYNIISSANAKLVKIDWRDEGSVIANLVGCDANCYWAVGARVHQSAKQWADAEGEVGGFQSSNYIHFCSDAPVNVVTSQFPSCTDAAGNDLSTATVQIAGYIDVSQSQPAAFADFPDDRRPGSSLTINWTAFAPLMALAQTDTLLHEWGHVLGMHHPIDKCENDTCEGKNEGRTLIGGTEQTHELVCFTWGQDYCLWRDRSTGEWLSIADNTNFGYDTVMVATLPFYDCETGDPPEGCPARDTLSADDILAIVNLYPEE